MYILAFWGFICFPFGLLGLHLLSFWPFGLHFLSFWPFRLSFPFIFCCRGCHVGPPHKLPKTVRFLIKFKQILSAARPAAFCNFWPFWPSFPFIFAFWAFISFHFGLLGFISFHFGLLAFISFHFGLLGLHFLHFGLLGFYLLSFWPFRASFPFILAFWGFISFHFGLLGLHFLSFFACRAATWGPPRKLPKTVRFLIKFKQILSAARPAALCNLWHFWHFLSFWLFEATGGYPLHLQGSARGVQILRLATAWCTRCAFYHVIYSVLRLRFNFVFMFRLSPFFAAPFRRHRFHCKKQGFLKVANVDFQNTRFATVSRHFRVSLQFRANEEDFTL